MKLFLPDHMHQHFDFLIDSYDFQLVLLSEVEAIYESHQVRVRIVYDNRFSHELYCELSLRKNATSQYELIGDLRSFEAMSENLEKGVTFPFQASSSKALDYSISFIAAYLKDYGGDLLRGDEALFGQLEVFISQINLKYKADIQVEAMRRDATLAWAERDYKAVKSIYEKHRKTLIPSEQLKLNYACRKLEKLNDR